MELLILVATLFATFNVILLLGLIYLYARIVTKTRAGYSAGLLIFAVLLLFHNVVTLFGYTVMGGLFNDQLYPVLVAVTVCEGHCLDIRRRRASAMKGQRVFGVFLLLIGLLAVSFFKDAISSLLLVGIWGGMVLLVLVFVVGGTILVAIRGED